MNFKKSVILLVVASLSMVSVTCESLLPEQDADIRLTRSMARTRSLDCFKYYIPHIEKMNKEYQADFAVCRQASIDAYSQAEIASLDRQYELTFLAESSCFLLSHCSDLGSPAEIFDCFAKEGLENLKTMYNINTHATENLNNLQENFRLIESKEYKCTNDTKRLHEKKIMQSYVDLDNCLSDHTDAPIPAETSVKTSTGKITTVSTETSAEITTPEAFVETAAKPVTSKEFVLRKLFSET